MDSESIDQNARWRIAAAIFFSQSLFSAALIMSFTLTPIIVTELESFLVPALSGNAWLAGIPSTTLLLGRASGAYPAGWLLDRIGRRYGLTLGYLLAAVGATIAVFSITGSSLEGFLLGQYLFGAARSMVDQGRYVAAEVFPSSRRAKVIGLIISAGTIGAVGGPLLVEPAGRFAESIAFSLYAGPFMAAALFVSFAALLIFVLLRPDPLILGRQLIAAEHKAAHGDAPLSNAVRSLGQIFQSSYVIVAVGAMMIGQMVMTLLMVITPLHMDNYAHATGTISLVVMAHTLGMFGLSPLTGWLVDRFGRLAMIVAGAIVLVSACVVAPLSLGAVESPFVLDLGIAEVPFDAVILGLALFLLGLGWNFCFVAGSSLLSDQLAPGERGRVQGASEVAVALGAGSGSVSSGIIFAEMGGIPAVAIFGLVMSLAIFALAIWRMIPRSGEQAFVGD